MSGYSKKVEVRWSDMDPNFHLRHSVYYDWGAYVRISFLNEHLLTAAVLQQYHFGPILFREECIFKREVLFGDFIEINLQMRKCSADMSRWTMIHEIWRNNNILSAIITVDGAWMDTNLRKLAVPPATIMQGFEAIPKAEGFELVE